MYDVFLERVLLPVAPSKIQTKIKNQNKTITLINEGEINLLKSAGLTEITFSALLPNSNYPFAVYVGGFQNASYYTGHLEKLKAEKTVFQFIVSRAFPNGKTSVNLSNGNSPFAYNEYSMAGTNIKVTLEDYTAEEDAKNGFDLTVNIKLKQFRPYGTKTAQITEQETAHGAAQGEAAVAVQKERPAETAPQIKKYTIVAGDTLWAIAKKYYNNGSDYTKIFEANKDKITNPNLIYPGTEITIP